MGQHKLEAGDYSPQSEEGPSTFAYRRFMSRPVMFWITLVAVIIALTVLLREILLPFVAAFAFAYLLDPLASRLERLGLNRLTATLAITGLFIAVSVALVWLSVPIIVRELS